MISISPPSLLVAVLQSSGGIYQCSLVTVLKLCYKKYLQPVRKQRKGKERNTKKICATRIEGEIRRKRTMFFSESVATFLQEISSTSKEKKKGNREEYKKKYVLHGLKREE